MSTSDVVAAEGIDVRRFATLGGFRNDWLNARHHFSFGNYYDASRMGVGRLRVWNDDEIAPGTGFDAHPHRDMEIITFVRDGAISHRDNLGNQGRTEAGDVQVMSAGTGIVHAEYNLEKEPTRIFQIWIEPDIRGAKPSWGARSFPKATERAGFTILASGRPADGFGATADQVEALSINADAAVAAATIASGQTATWELARGRKAYLVPARGRIAVNGVAVGTRDGVAIEVEGTIEVAATEDAEIVLVDVRG